MGTERKLARLHDLVPEFYNVMLECKVQVEARLYLFPIAVASPGWMHGWDVVLQRGLSSLSFFSVFLVGFRALVAFCRSKLWRGQLVRHLKSQGLVVMAQVIDAIRMPSVTEWRWGTLSSACKSLLAVFGTLAHYFRPELFGSCKDGNKTINAAANALASPRFHAQLKFVGWYSDWLCTIQSWGKGSKQRDQALLDGSDFDPLWNGRRLPEAATYVQEALRRGLTEANSWTTETFGCDHETLLQLQACVRGSFHLAQKRHAYLFKLPWLLARLLDPGVKALCIQQYLACDNHHPLSDMFFAADGALKPDVDAVDESGRGASAALVKAVDSIAAIPFDDSVAESPHAVGNSFARHARASFFPWIASTMRLPQNLRDVRDWCQALCLDITQEWLVASSVLQTAPRNYGKPMRIKPAEFRNRFYHMSLFCTGLRNPGNDDDI